MELRDLYPDAIAREKEREMNKTFMKFEALRCDLEDEHRERINKLISSVAKSSYNRGISDSQDALLAIATRGEDQKELAEAAENAICENYVKGE